MRTPKNLPLLIAVCIPVLMIVFVAASIYLPALFIKPQYDFLYLTGQDYGYCTWDYRVENKKLVRVVRSNPYKEAPQECTTQFFRYDVEENANREVTLEEAQTLTLDGNGESPDGFTVTRGGNGGGFFPLFSEGGNYNSIYLTKGSAVSRKITLRTGPDYYPEFRLLGWVLP